ncbi:hypothetical protein A4X13_0g3809 [Tilletia indica]|uniref:Uncharacterized protein n=1 Tax=Tilletia indica TaxID=43049 RepID=A0A177TGK2_9BASI|nr:hypothetical protein A4X13_0g3809 [Tilletia indica]
MSVDYKTTDAQVAAQLKQSFGIAIKQNTINKARNAIIGSAKLSQEAEFQYIEAWLTRVAEKDPGAIVEHHTEGGTFSPTIDVDSNLVILAWALVPTESQDTWEWFLAKLLSAVSSLGLSSSTIISDRQKGLLAAIKKVLPDTIEGFCCWHLAENVKKHYGEEARRLFWPLVYAQTKTKFDTCMNALRECKPGAAEYLSDNAVPHKFWASYVFPGPRFDHVTSNLSEIANSALRQHRELPPLQIMSGIYEHEMSAFHERAQAASLWKQSLAPHPHGLLLTAIELARRMNAAPASALTGLVTSSSGKTFEVKLAENPAQGLSSCTCGFPGLMLLPCPHLCCLATVLKRDASEYAWSYWKTVQWRNTYEIPYTPISRDNLVANEVQAPSSVSNYTIV